MSVLRSQNFLNSQRVDIPHLRSIDSGVIADFDLGFGTIQAGSESYVVTGFDILTTNAIGNLATALVLNVAGGVIIHPLASVGGSIFAVSNTATAQTLSADNTNIVGSFTPSQINFIGLDLTRAPDNTTADTVMFEDVNTNQEFPMVVPLGRTLQYVINISTINFASTPNILPLAQVTTNNFNIVTEIVDCRPMFYRLGSGGATPDTQYTYAWPQGRNEDVQNTAGAVFQGGDKALASLKDSLDAIMTRIWELGGGEYWYMPTSDRDIKIAYGQPVLGINSDNFYYDGTNLSWSGITILIANSTATYNTVTAGTLALPDGYCLYVDINRQADSVLTVPTAVPLTNIGTPTIPGSRFIFAWRKGNYVFARDLPYEVGRAYKVATNNVGSAGLGVIRLSAAAGNIAEPTVVPLDANGTVTYTNTITNQPAFAGTGNGTGNGGDFYGGTDGSGVYGQGGGNGSGGWFYGGAATGFISIRNGCGVYAEGGSNGGMGVYGVGVSGQTGGLFTSDVGPALVGQAGIGTAYSVEGLGGNIAVDSTKDFVYTAAKIKHYHVGGIEFKNWTSAIPIYYPEFLPGWLISGGNTDLGAAVAHLPAGATLIGVQVLVNGDLNSSTLTGNVMVGVGTYATGGYTYTSACTTSVNIPASIAWVSVSGFSSVVVPADGFVLLQFTTSPQAGQNTYFYSMRVTYTQTTVAPTN
jgi:hypothetical protein